MQGLKLKHGPQHQTLQLFKVFVCGFCPALSFNRGGVCANEDGHGLVSGFPSAAPNQVCVCVCIYLYVWGLWEEGET